MADTDEPTAPAPPAPAISIEEEMKASYLDYAMSVIVSRALPDVRDGLKPVHRRILYAMEESGYQWNKPYKKSARIVGDVMGKYHPHGDSAIYDALVRMAQDFSMRLPLVDGQGNFGSMDGDPPAAMRYTEARMAKAATTLLEDIDKDTVDYQDNYDGSEREPVVLPARFPNLLVNGAAGIAVGMATNIPPHNLGEVIDAAVALIDDPSLTSDDLIAYVPGPDFPTGGLVLGRGGIRSAYETGRGSILIRSKSHIEEVRGRDAIALAHELAYGFYTWDGKPHYQGRIWTLHDAFRVKAVDCIRISQLIGCIYANAGYSGLHPVRIGRGNYAARAIALSGHTFLDWTDGRRDMCLDGLVKSCWQKPFEAMHARDNQVVSFARGYRSLATWVAGEILFPQGPMKTVRLRVPYCDLERRGL